MQMEVQDKDLRCQLMQRRRELQGLKSHLETVESKVSIILMLRILTQPTALGSLQPRNCLLFIRSQLKCQALSLVYGKPCGLQTFAAAELLLYPGFQILNAKFESPGS